MNLTCKIPSDVVGMVEIAPEEIWYASPYDLIAEQKRSGQKRFCDKGYILVTKEELIVTREDQIVVRERLTELEDIRHQVLVNNGLLIIKKDGKERIAARFSMRYLTAVSYIATGARWLSDGYEEKVVSTEIERICSRCGRGMRTSRCLHCDGRWQSIKRFWKLCGSFQKRLILVSICMILAALINLITPEIQQQFIDDSLLHRTGDGSDVALFVIKMFVVLSLLLAVNLLRNWWCATLGAGISMELRTKMIEKIQELSLSFIHKRKPGDIINRVINDTAHVRRFMEDIFSNMISTMIMMIGAFVAMLVMSPVLTVCSTGLILAVIGLHRIFRRYSHRLFRIQRHKEDKMHSALQDVISGIRVVKVFGKEKEESVRFKKDVGGYARAQRNAETFWAVFFPVLTFIMGLGVYLATYFGGLDVLNGRMTVGQLMQFITYTGILYGPLGWLNRLPMMFRRMVTSLERIYDVLDEIPDVDNKEKPVRLEVGGRISIDNITFGYESYEPVLENVSLDVEEGEMIGLVGPSGAGKSTLINLIMRLYDVNRGKITLDGHDLRDIDKAYYHSQIGVVLQETFLFSDTILNNLRFAKPDATLEEIIKAAKAANAHDFIIKTPDGYNTYVGEHGYNVSGGQRQRIAIARAILTNPRILILDEATSALDTESEYLIQQALERLQAGRTTFAIAHRLSTLRKADRLVVIDEHRIAEVGSHNELLQKGGIYAGLVEAQLEMQNVTVKLN